MISFMSLSSVSSKESLSSSLSPLYYYYRQSSSLSSSSSDATVVDDNIDNKDDDDDEDEIYVMVNGMPGPMATAAAEACLRKGLQLTPIAMTGPNHAEPMTIHIYDPISERSSTVKLIPSSQTQELAAMIQGLQEAYGIQNILAIDYTHPNAVQSNMEFYIQQRLPFVMGTTGGNNREILIQKVNTAKHFAIIAPNMAKQIVAMQAAIQYLAIQFPGSFCGYTIQCKESHQKTKADTSGTAKAVIDSLKQLVVVEDYDDDDDASSSFTYQDIEMIRNDQEAIEFGVPEDALQGHAFHRYTLTSADGTTQFALEHNVVGRTIYAEGTADAIRYLANKVRNEKEGKVYTMIDVLQENALQ